MAPRDRQSRAATTHHRHPQCNLGAGRATVPSMSKNPAGALSLVLIPAVVTLLVTILRLVGELEGWNDQIFSNVPPHGEPKPGWMGIAYLVPIFGFWFGWRLRRATGEPAHVGKAALRMLIGGVCFIGGLALCLYLGWIKMPSADEPGTPSGTTAMLVIIAVSAAILLVAWPRLAGTLALYGLLARIPVLIITYLAIHYGWDTHHVKLPPGTQLPDESDRLLFLAMPQVTFWIVYTMLFGGLFGCLGAKLTKAQST